MPIKCKYFRQNKDQNSAVAGSLCLYIEEWDLYLPKCKMIRTNEGKHFIAAPAELVTNHETGKSEYQNFWWFGKKMGERFQKSALEAVNAFIAEKEKEAKGKSPVTEPAKSMSDTIDDLDNLPF